jgi:hypothetical protein
MIIASVLSAALCSAAHAAPVITLQNGNATASIDPITGEITGVSVADISEVQQQSIFYRVGTTGPALPLSTLKETTIFPSGESPEGGPPYDNVFMNYTGPGFTVSVSYSLIGGSSPVSASQLTNEVFFTGTSQTPIALSAFQYDHFVLSNSFPDSVSVADGQVTQTQTTGIRSAVASVAPLSAEYQVGPSPDVLDTLAGAHFTQLNSELNSAGPGDVEFALESDTLLANHAVFPMVTIDTFNPGVPLPPAVWMGLTTLTAIGSISLIRRKLRSA